MQFLAISYICKGMFLWFLKDQECINSEHLFPDPEAEGQKLLNCYFYLAYLYIVIKDDFLVIRAAHTQN